MADAKDIPTSFPSKEDNALVLTENMQALTEVLDLLLELGNIDIEETIHRFLKFTGSHTRASRAYIFELLSNDIISNTYEWVADGIPSNIHAMSMLPVDDFFAYLLKHELIAEDIRILSDFLQSSLKKYGVKAIAAMPLTLNNKTVGFVGFIDTLKHRTYSREEHLLLHHFADMATILLERRNNERMIANSIQIMQTVTDNAQGLIFVSDLQTRELLFVNNGAAALLGKSVDEVVDEQILICDACKIALNISCDNCPHHSCDGEPLDIVHERSSWECESRAQGKWYLAQNSYATWIDGRDVLIENLTDITRQKEYEMQLEYIASRDGMTGIYNREWGHRFIQAFIDNSVSLHTLTFIDIDGLKRVNDEHGHKAGDSMILKVVELINHHVRKGDIFCRWGGDEFILITPGGIDSANLILERIKKALTIHNESKSTPYLIDFSYGMAEIDHNREQTLDSIIQEADNYMYQHKTSKWTS